MKKYIISIALIATVNCALGMEKKIISVGEEKVDQSSDRFDDRLTDWFNRKFKNNPEDFYDLMYKELTYEEYSQLTSDK